MKNFAELTTPLTNLLREKISSQNILWNSRCQDSFEALKKTLTSAPMLKVTNPRVDGIVLCIDDNDLTIVVILM
jgi:hypothetical protein